MNCSSSELKDYFFGELGPAERASVEQHVAGCARCRDELAGLNATRAALLSVPDEEPPRRIAFVSDKVFEPRWWQKLWRSGPQAGFASAAILAAAIVAHGFLMAPPPAVASAPAATVPAAAPAALIEAEVAKRVQVEVAKAMAAREDEQLVKTLDVVNARLKEARAEQRDQVLMIRDYLERVQKENATLVSRVMYE